MTLLCQIAAKWGTDKLGVYTPVYHTLLEGRRDQVRKVLEIGIGHRDCMRHVPDYQAGASLRMWREYFPHAEIYALDNQRDILVNEQHIRSRVCDQSKRGDLLTSISEFGGDWDLIVDDGSHDAEHQWLSAVTLMPFVKNGGLYIIEDTHEPEKISDRLPFEHTVITHKHTATDVGRFILIRKEN